VSQKKTWCRTFCAKFYGKKCYIYFIDNLLLFPTAKEFSKSVNSWWSCHKKFDTTFFFWDYVYCIMWVDLSALNGCFMLLSDNCLFLEGLEGGNGSTGTVHIYAKANLARIWSSGPDDFLNLMGTFLSKDTSMVNFSWRCGSFFCWRCEPNCGKMPHLTVLKNPSMIFPDPGTEDLQNLIRSSSSTLVNSPLPSARQHPSYGDC